MAHILLIDDDELLRDTLNQMLCLDGHQVTEAGGGAQGLTLFKQFRGRDAFDLVITDVLMPGVDGTRVIVELRGTAPDLPIIAISGGRRVLSPQFNLQTAALAGATCQLAKPFNRRDLQSAVTEALAKADG
jgi:CheY-like chemotaxis protein